MAVNRQIKSRVVSVSSSLGRKLAGTAQRWGLSLRQFLAECLNRIDACETSPMHPGRGYERYFAASESTIASKRGSPRNGSQSG